MEEDDYYDEDEDDEDLDKESEDNPYKDCVGILSILVKKNGECAIEYRWDSEDVEIAKHTGQVFGALNTGLLKPKLIEAVVDISKNDKSIPFSDQILTSWSEYEEKIMLAKKMVAEMYKEKTVRPSEVFARQLNKGGR